LLANGDGSGKNLRQLMDSLGIIAGNGEFPLIFASSARQQGVSRLVAVAFEGETNPEIEKLVDEIEWVRIGQLN